ncbi:MAG TPA: adenine phosphoribosyltransferase [Gammaproteobacteria bacterium]|nr:adenine phosphoribosyltransferase [Gammaproteobacteria bacterium]
MVATVPETSGGRLLPFVRDVPDFPKPGIVFKDIMPLLADPGAFVTCIEALAAPWREEGVDIVCGIEARGFIFAAAMAERLGAGFVPLRKPGKLPGRVLGADYALEYGSARLEAQVDAVRPGARVLLVDDVLATGGTLVAARAVLEQLHATIAGAAVVIELPALGGRARWPGDEPLHALLAC